MARLNLLAAFPIIGLLMCGTAHAEDKGPTPPATPPAANPAAPPPPPKDHVMHADELFHKNGAPPTEAERRAAHEELRKKFEAMTPEQRKAFFEQRSKEMQARIDAMTPEQREAFKKQMEERRAQVLKEHQGGMMSPPMDGGKPPVGKPPEGKPPAPPTGAPPHEPPPHDGDHKAPPPPPASNEKGQPPAGGQPSSDKH